MSPSRCRDLHVLKTRPRRWQGAHPCGSDPRSRTGDTRGFRHPRAVRPGAEWTAGGPQSGSHSQALTWPRKPPRTCPA